MRTKRTTIKSVAEACLLKGLGAQETLDAVKRVFPTAKTTLKCIYYYSHHLQGFSLNKGAQANEKELKKLQKTLAA